ncbi:MAG: SH3 domain-containing protein, partial [Chloroflexota bacterium]
MSDTMRVNYFFRQFLQAEDFITDQAYHREKVQSLARYLFTMGVVEGFEVTEATVRGDVGVAVSAGMALDTQGRQIVLEKSANIPLAKYKGETVKLIIQYKEHLLDNRDDETQRDFIQKVDGEYYTARVLERPGFAILPEKKALEDGMIILAQIRISTSGAIRSIDMDVRPLVRAKGVPEPKPITPSDPQLVDTINGDFTVKGDLRVDGVLKTVGQLTTAWFADNVTADVAIRSVGSWENIAGMTIDMGLERDAVVTCQYTINVQANRQPLEMPDDLPEAPVVHSLTPSVPAGEGLFLVNQTDTNAMVRSVARTRGNATVRGRVPPGDVVEVIEPSADEARSLVGKAGEWVKIRMRDGTEGWTSMSSYRVRATGDAQMISNDEQVATGRFVEYKVVAGDQLGQIVINQGLATG